MTSLAGEALKEALDHDAAQKAAEHAPSPVGFEGPQAPIPADQLLNAMEIKQAFLAKSVSLALVQIAQQFVGRATSGKFQVEGKNGEPAVESRVVDPKQAEHLLSVAGKALDLAARADAIADRAAVRLTEPPTQGAAS